MAKPVRRHKKTFKQYLHEVIFEADTFKGKIFDILLLISIVLSIIILMLESVPEFDSRYGELFRLTEWSLTILFTLEYAARIYAVERPSKYIFSLFGLVDLLAVLPTYLSVIFAGGQYFMIVRVIRLLRVFRVFKLVHYLGEGKILMQALKASRFKITVFIGGVISLVVIMGTLMYMIEGPENGFNNIPVSVYWAIVTLTTVGYGDLAPQTLIGQFFASFIMIMGYGIIAVPTGIVSVELAEAGKKVKEVHTQACPSCGAGSHDYDARFCKYCGADLKREL